MLLKTFSYQGVNRMGKGFLGTFMIIIILSLNSWFIYLYLPSIDWLLNWLSFLLWLLLAGRCKAHDYISVHERSLGLSVAVSLAASFEVIINTAYYYSAIRRIILPYLLVYLTGGYLILYLLSFPRPSK